MTNATTTPSRILPPGQRGFSLIELMVAMALGLILIAATMTMFGTTIRANTELLKNARLSSDTGAIMSLMRNDIRRAGYSNGSTIMFPEGYDLSIPTANCILYSYDNDRNGKAGPDEFDIDGDGTFEKAENFYGTWVSGGSPDAGDNSEWFGFRYNSTRKSIEMRTSCSDSDANCATDCTKGSWETMVGEGASYEDPILVTGLSFTSNGSKCVDASDVTYWIVNAADSRNFGCATDPGDGDAYRHDGTNYVLDTSGAVSAPNTGDRIVDVRQVNITLSACFKSTPTATTCAADAGETTLVESVRVRNDFVREVP